MHIFAGLGNPGAQYRINRHNIGFMAVDAIHDDRGFGPWSAKFRSEVAEGAIGGEKVLLVKPQTFMNLSGEALGAVLRFYKLETAVLTVFHDDLGLQAGRIKVKTGGGNGGHNGLKSIDAHCGKDYQRVRLGIGHPGDKSRVLGHVLGNFGVADVDWIAALLGDIARYCDLLLQPGQESLFMNKTARAAALAVSQ